jgi:hypothetical protein
MKGVSKKALEESLAALDEAAKLIRRKFPQVLYGRVFVSKSLGKHAASYVHSTDSIQLSLRARKTLGDIDALCHEFGHRYEHKFFKNRVLRSRFWELSTTPKFENLEFDKTLRAHLADEFIAMADRMREGRPVQNSEILMQWTVYFTSGPSSVLANLQGLTRKYVSDKVDSARQDLWDAVALPEESGILTVNTKKVIQEPLAVTSYGATKPTENFAEAFSHYVMGKPLHPEFAAILEALD